jgi:putative serine protease PepD
MARDLPLWARDDDPGTAEHRPERPRPLEADTLRYDGASWHEAQRTRDHERGAAAGSTAAGATAAGRAAAGGRAVPGPSRGPSPFLRTASAVAAVVLLVALGAVGAATLLGGDDAGDSRTATQAPLAAAPGSVDRSQVGKIYTKVARSVVQVERSGGSGTAFLIDADGTMVTNAHVVAGASDVRVVLDEGRPPTPAQVLGTDSSSDLAVLKVDAGDVRGREPLALTDSDQVEVGDEAIAIGFPLGLEETVTTGIVSGVGRAIEAPNGFSIDQVIQTDAPINPGNSGGPLLDARGRVMGVNSQIATRGAGGGSIGIGFAVPSNTVRQVVPTLKAGGTVARPYIGVSTTDMPDGSAGALVREVRPGSPAARAGLRGSLAASGAGADRITSVDGDPVRRSGDVAQAIQDREPGDVIAVVIERDGRRQTLDVRLDERPANAGP